MKSIKFLPLLIMLLILPLSLSGQDTAENPATVIMHKVIEKMKINEELKHKHLNFKKHYVDMKLDDSSRPTKIIADQVIEVRPPKGDEVLIQEDGKPKNKKQDSGGEFEKIIEALSLLFNYEMSKPTTDCPTCPIISKNGVAYLVIDFKANGNIKANGDNVKEIMNRSAGKIYVDIENLYIQQFESNLTRTYDRGWSIFQFRLKQADSVFKQGEIDTPEGKIIVVISSTIKYRYSLFGEKFGIRSWIYGDYLYIS